MDGKVKEGVTLNTSTRASVVEEEVLDLLVTSEQVEGKRLITRVDKVNGGLDIPGGDDGKDRAEDLARHDRVIDLDVRDNSGWHELGSLVTLTTEDDLALGAGEHRVQTLPVASVDDTGVAVRVADTTVALGKNSA